MENRKDLLHEIKIVPAGGCQVKVIVDGVLLRGIQSMRFEALPGEVPKVTLEILSDRVCIGPMIVECSLSELLMKEVEETKKLLELANEQSLH